MFRSEKSDLPDFMPPASIRLSPDIQLEAFGKDAARLMGEKMAAMEPWRTLTIGARNLTAILLRKVPYAASLHVTLYGRSAGAMVIRHPWLFGPYLEVLAILPEFQNRGLGSRLLLWLEEGIAVNHGNVWVAASAFNRQAVAFYEKNGFERVALLRGLVRPEHDEILFRKRLIKNGQQ